MPPMAVKLKVQFGIMIAAVIVDFIMFIVLVIYGKDIQAGVAALVGGLVGAITTLVAMGSKDLFNPDDDRPEPPKDTP